MNVSELAQALELVPVALADGERAVRGAYCGDLLSWVMGRARSGDVWITIMSNINVVAVASLSDAVCVIFAEGVSAEPAVVEAALAKGVHLFSSARTAYELAAALSDVLT